MTVPLKETSLEEEIINRHQKSKYYDSVISENVNLKLFIYNIEHKSNYTGLSVVAFFILKFSIFEWNIRQTCFAL